MAILMVAVSFLISPAKSFAFGDAALMIPYLIKQLAEMYKQYAQLQMIVGQGKSNADFLRLINSGMDNIAGLIATLPIQDEKILSEIRSLQIGTEKLREIYGMIPKSGVAPMQSLHDQTIAESLTMSNRTRDYANGQEANANRAFQMSGTMSPKGAERLSVATQAQILHVLSQLLKIDGQILKLQSEQFAMTNMGSKDSVNHFNKVNSDVKKSLGSIPADFSLPRFQ